MPKKFIVTSKRVTGAPQFTVLFKGGNLSPQLKDEIFAFAPPQDARQIDFLGPASTTGAPMP